MKYSTFCRTGLALAAVALTHAPATASACSVCMGNPGTKTASAINGAIFLLLGFIGFVLSAMAAFGYSLMKKANAPVPPHAELDQMMNPLEDKD